MDSRLNKTLWMQGVLPMQLRRLSTDVCHFTNSVAPWWTPCPCVITIHDMTVWMFPKCHPRRRLLAMRPIIPLAARRASAIIAVSASTKRDLIRILGVRAEKVHVVYEAPAPHFRRLPASAAPWLEHVRARYGLPEKFVLYVGTIEPRKNLPRLLQAFTLLRASGGEDYGLVLVGNR
ncbi:MAG: glycosyltransferase, partial [Chloroflexi bacterium]|nr:glycosyltransferase [Chloroflexota bacterium]